jgi:hypothetical protein
MFSAWRWLEWVNPTNAYATYARKGFTCWNAMMDCGGLLISPTIHPAVNGRFIFIEVGFDVVVHIRRILVHRRSSS